MSHKKLCNTLHGCETFLLGVAGYHVCCLNLDAFGCVSSVSDRGLVI